MALDFNKKTDTFAGRHAFKIYFLVVGFVFVAVMGFLFINSENLKEKSRSLPLLHSKKKKIIQRPRHKMERHQRQNKFR